MRAIISRNGTSPVEMADTLYRDWSCRNARARAFFSRSRIDQELVL